MRPLGAIAVMSLLALAGCIQLPDDPNEEIERQPSTGGTMTASETTTNTTEVCTSDIGPIADRFCAERVVKVTGTLAGFDRLDVALETFNGAITIGQSSGDAWGFTATLRARGATAAEAMAKLDDIDFSWAHEDASGHFVEVIAEHDGSSDSRSVALDLSMPRSVLMRISAATSNGGVTLDGGRTDGLALTTSNGKIVAKGDATQVALTTSNGEIDAALRPIGDGRWALTTSNGEIALKVPEGDAYGYSIQGQTSNGEVDYTLRDGEKGACPQGSQYYTPPCNVRSFESSGFRGRDHQVYASLTTSNGEINVGPS